MEKKITTKTEKQLKKVCTVQRWRGRGHTTFIHVGASGTVESGRPSRKRWWGRFWKWIAAVACCAWSRLSRPATPDGKQSEKNADDAKIILSFPASAYGRISNAKYATIQKAMKMWIEKGEAKTLHECPGIGVWTRKAFELMCKPKERNILLTEDSYIRKRFAELTSALHTPLDLTLPKLNFKVGQ